VEIDGALWYATDRDSGEKRRDKDGNPYFKGTIKVNGEVCKVVAFVNKEKQNPRSPDIKIMVSKPMGGSSPATQPAAVTAADDFEDDSIPF